MGGMKEKSSRGKIGFFCILGERHFSTWKTGWRY